MYYTIQERATLVLSGAPRVFVVFVYMLFVCVVVCCVCVLLYYTMKQKRCLGNWLMTFSGTVLSDAPRMFVVYWLVLCSLFVCDLRQLSERCLWAALSLPPEVAR